jgi:hypothetical protein
LRLDRDNPAACLDALTGDGVEQRIDLGVIGDRTFVNNASFGAYAEVVESPAYRDDKRGTTLQVLPDLLSGHRGAKLTAQEGDATVTGPQALLVSNNPYEMTDVAGLGRRAQLDTLPRHIRLSVRWRGGGHGSGRTPRHPLAGPAVPNGTGVRAERTDGGNHRGRWPPARRAAPQAPWEGRPVMTPHAVDRTNRPARLRIRVDTGRPGPQQAKDESPGVADGRPWVAWLPAGEPEPVGANARWAGTAPMVTGG